MERMFSWEMLMAQVVEDDSIEEMDDIKGMAEEADGCMSWRYFFMEVTEGGIVMHKDSISLEWALEVVNNYCDLIEEDEDDFEDRTKYRKMRDKYGIDAFNYDRMTKPFRGADDGTYDYAVS